MSLERGPADRLTINMTPKTAPTVSPDGDRVALVFTAHEQSCIVLMSPDGSSLTRLTTGASSDDSPAWWPRWRRD